MKIKRYLARNMPEAMSMVREDLGQEAVIIFSRKVRGKGVLGFLAPPLIEVTAALDEAPGACETPGESPSPAGEVQVMTPVNAGGMPSVIPPPAKTAAPQAAPAPGDGKAKTAGAAAPAPPDESPRVAEPLRRELADLKRMLGRLLERQGPPGADEPFLQQWRRLLAEMDIDITIVERLLDRLRQNVRSPADTDGRARDLIIEGLEEILAPAYTGEDLKSVLVFVGPTGVGKTTTLAKLAAQLALIEHRRVAMVTIDTYRLGAVEQLRTYAEIMDLPLEVALTPGDLAQALARHADADYILVDTAGRPSKNREQVRELQGFLQLIDRPFDVLLVLSSNTKMRDLGRITSDFQVLDYAKLVFTKVDETETLGCLINVVHEVGRPVVYITNGQNVPYDIRAVDPQRLVRMVVERVGNNA
ncbi:MAG: flagellar biosynthesis protein FlhF [Thermoanaerobacterales bacterium]|nr:flagellar biosynthesis protein FlhF [Thermoanaerobacterales bacterium]